MVNRSRWPIVLAVVVGAALIALVFMRLASATNGITIRTTEIAVNETTAIPAASLTASAGTDVSPTPRAGQVEPTAQAAAERSTSTVRQGTQGQLGRVSVGVVKVRGGVYTTPDGTQRTGTIAVIALDNQMLTVGEGSVVTIERLRWRVEHVHDGGTPDAPGGSQSYVVFVPVS